MAMRIIINAKELKGDFPFPRDHRKLENGTTFLENRKYPFSKESFVLVYENLKRYFCLKNSLKVQHKMKCT